MNRLVFILAATTLMLFGLPLAGVWLAGYPLARYFEFPPETRYVQHAPFSWVVFTVYSAFIVGVVTPFIRQAIRFRKQPPSAATVRARFPWWGWLGVVTGFVSWILAWTRFDWMAELQPHTFTPLWLSYILVVNGLTHRRSGHCLMTSSPGFFMVLFPVSALFWWFFEYLNRFVQNWSYTGDAFDAWEYFWYATLPFSTVLPAVLSTRNHLLSLHWLQDGFRNFSTPFCQRLRPLAGGVLLLAAGGLAAIGIWPDYLFSLLWTAPLLIIVAGQVLLNVPHIFRGAAAGDWRTIVASALAALVCGWFWEMWNFYSLARWTYSIPFVQRFPVFEMPILGYAGYLPFGLECAVVAEVLGRLSGRRSGPDR